MRIIDLSHTITSETVSYKGFPAPVICDYLSREQSAHLYEEGTSFQIARMDMVTNTGTYLDSPFHRYVHGKDLSEISLQRLVRIPALIVRNPWKIKLETGIEDLHHLQVRNKAVLIHTGWDKKWMTEDYYSNHPYLTEDAANWLFEQGASLVGIDSHNIDDTRGKGRPVHSVLLHQDIYIVEHLSNLDNIPEHAIVLFTAVPPKIKGVGTFPVRAFAEIA
ncbi:MAG TPA: cyclase family protein [Saprospiraceae bacterium]|nr:cyclase family protein [Saprospiraceae bacterium]